MNWNYMPQGIRRFGVVQLVVLSMLQDIQRLHSAMVDLPTQHCNMHGTARLPLTHSFKAQFKTRLKPDRKGQQQ